MSKSIQLKNKDNEKIYPCPYYPVGSIYLSINNTNPAEWFGGTWEQIAQGRTLVGVDINDTDFSNVNKVGGEKVHTLTESEIPKHRHPILYQKRAYSGTSGAYFADFPLVEGFGTSGQENLYYYSLFANYNENCGNSHNNMPPYFTCYIWCRTA